MRVGPDVASLARGINRRTWLGRLRIGVDDDVGYRHVRQDESQERSDMLWKIYFGLLALLNIGGWVTLLILGPDTPYPWADYILTGVNSVQVVGLFGFAFKRPILALRFWRVVFPIFLLNLAATIIMIGIRFSLARDGQISSAIALASPIVLLIYLPAVIANYRYAFRSPDIWKQAPA
jgi:hypothetical protein